MKKGILLSALLVSIVGVADATPLTPDEALARLQQSNGSQRLSSAFYNPELKKIVPASNGEAALYVFGNSNNKGFFLVSAEDCTVPLLGYSDSSDFDEENMAPGFRYWLETYSRQISYIKSSNVKFENYEEDGVGLPDWAPIEPLVKSQWNQDAPFNNDCPKINGLACYTGCVATSLAQVMRYFRYPEVGQGSISYRPSNMRQNLSINFAETPFDYDNMIDVYQRGNYTEAQADAVATLMKAAGYSVQMEYSTEFSGALSALLVTALVDYFKYDPSVAYYDRSNYEYTEWAEMIYNEIAKGQPIIYDGTAPLSGGHSFICDGYDGNGYFHFNWGWGGMSDGYYSLDALNPSSIGIGGYSGGFNFDQDAVIGIKPYEGGEVVEETPVLKQYGALYGTIDKSNLKFGLRDSYPYMGWAYSGLGSANLALGVIVEKISDPSVVQNVMLPGFSQLLFTSGQYLAYDGSYDITLSLAGLGLDSGEDYKITFASRENGNSSNKWVPVSSYVGFPNYVIVKKSGLSYEVENIPVAKFEANNLEVLSTLYFGCPVKLKATISNNTDLQISRGVCLILTDEDGTQRFMGDSFFLTLDPGQSIEKEWVSTLNKINGADVTTQTEFKAYLYDLETSMYYDSEGMTVIMEPNPGSPTIMSGISILNSRDENDVKVVTNNRNMEVEMSLVIGRGYFSYPVSIHILESREGSNYLFSVISETFEEIPFLEGGERITLSANLDFPNPNPDEIYYMEGSYATNNSVKWINNQIQFKFDLAGVESLTESERSIKFFHDKATKTLTVFTPAGYESVQAYQLNGMEIPLSLETAEGYVNINLESLGKGIIVVRATDKAGNSNSVKVAL